MSLPDSPALLDTFLKRTPAPQGAPIIVLADEEDEHLANRLLREGAQDVLVKSELDCVPLARSVRYAVERQRRIAPLGSSPLVDDLTRALTREAFHHDGRALCAARVRVPHRPAAGQPGSRRPAGNAEDREARELLLMRAGEVLPGCFETPALIGHLERCRFGLMTAGPGREHRGSVA